MVKEGPVVQACQAGRQLFLAALGLWRDALRVARLLQRNRLEHNAAHGHGQRIAGLSRHELGDRTDITAADLGDFGRLLAADLIDMGHLLVGIRAAVDQRHILLDRAGEYLEVREPSILVGNRLKDHGHGRAVGRAVDLNKLALLVLADLSGCLVGGRHIVGNALEQRIGADTGRRGATEYGRDHAVTHALTDARDQLFIRELLAGKIALHELLRQLRNVLAQGGAVLVDAVDHILRDRDLDALDAVHAVCLADDTIDDTDRIAVALKIGTTIGQTETPNCFCSLCSEV